MQIEVALQNRPRTTISVKPTFAWPLEGASMLAIPVTHRKHPNEPWGVQQSTQENEDFMIFVGCYGERPPIASPCETIRKRSENLRVDTRHSLGLPCRRP